MRAGPQLRVDAYGVRRCGSIMPVCKQPVATLTLQAIAKENLADASILSTLIYLLLKQAKPPLYTE
jgi:hypothetical protein